MNKTLSDKNAKRIDLGLENPNVSSLVSIKLPNELEPGWYVVMWKVLSVDTHTTSDFVLFRYQAQ
jgi:copper resistance protein C